MSFPCKATKKRSKLKPAAHSTAKLSLWRFTRKSSRTVLFTRTDLFLTATRVPVPIPVWKH